MKILPFILCHLMLGINALGQHLPADQLHGNVKTVEESVVALDSNVPYSWQRFHNNDYHHFVSSARVDSLFHKQWLLTATSPSRQCVTKYDRNQEVIHRAWYDHVLEYKFREDFIYYEKGVLQFYELKNVPFQYTVQSSNTENRPQLRFSNNYNRKAYFEYNDSNDLTFEMSQDDFFQMGKFYHEYDLNGKPSLIKYFQNGQWLWSEDKEYDGEYVSLTFLFLNVKRFPFLIEKETRLPEKNQVELEYSLIPKGSLYKRPRSKKIIHKNDEQKTIGNEYWFNQPVALFDYEYKKALSNATETKNLLQSKTTSLADKKTFTDSIMKDGDGRIIEFSSYSDIYDTLLEKYIFKYNNQGDVIEVNSYQHDLSNRIPVAITINFDYTYDASNNWVEQVKSVNGTPVFKRLRRIAYYDDSRDSK